MALFVASAFVGNAGAQEWTDITNGDGNAFTVKYAEPSTHDVFETWTGSASKSHAFDWNQTVTNIPDGVYELSTNAMYRASLTYGTPTNCVLYATVGEYEYTTPIANFADYTSNEERGKIATQIQNNDAYKSKIGNIIIENGEAKIGIKSIGELAYCTNGYWFVCKKSTFTFKNVTDTYFAGLQDKINRMLTYAVESEAKTTLNAALTTYSEATVENIKNLQTAITEFLATASTTNPVDVTSYMTNPSFEGSSTTYWYQDLGYTQNNNRNIKQPTGWNLMYSSAKVGNTQYQSFMPQADGAKDGQCLYVRHRWSDVYAVEDLRQSVQELPAGLYQLVVAVKGGSSVIDANTLTLSAGNNTSTTVISEFDKNNYKDYSVTVIKTTDDETLDICYGLKQISSGNPEQLYYIDDFRLYYCGEDVAKVQLQNTIESVAELNTTVNVGNEPFQIPSSAVTTLVNAVKTANEALNAEDATTESYTVANTALEEAIAAYKNVDLNAPSEDARYVFTFHNEAHDANGNAITLIEGGRSDQGNYGLKYLAPTNANYAQAFALTKATGTNCYYLSQINVNGVPVYLTTATLGYNANNYHAGLRFTTDATKALEVQIQATATEGHYVLYNTLAQAAIAHNGNKNNDAFTNNSATFTISEAEQAEVTLTVKETGWATLILPFNAEISDDITLYSCAEVNESNELVLVEAESIVANTPYIVKGVEGAKKTYDFAGYGLATADTYTAGLLTGVYKQTTATANTYVLQNHDGEVAFYLVGEVLPEIGANRCFLTAQSATAPMFSLERGEGTTSIEDAELTNETVVIYDLAGRRVEKMEKGIYIVNGKKVIR